jgi:hypothetical protein
MFEVKEFQLKRLSFDMALRDVQGLRHPWNQWVFEADPHLHHSIHTYIYIFISFYNYILYTYYIYVYVLFTIVLIYLIYSK